MQGLEVLHNGGQSTAQAVTPALLKKVVKESRPIPDDDDGATAATVRMMCDYIKAGLDDPICKQWAADALKTFGDGSPGSRFWSAWWLIKHRVRFQRDEPTLDWMGDGDARDFLTAPAVLVRQTKPKEDCDGFTMLGCCLLKLLGLAPYIVTVKSNPEKPWLWSHVFAMVDLPVFGPIAFDCSHGSFPGWMVPREHIFDYQGWDLDGRPVQAKLPLGASSALHGYRPKMFGRPRRRGMGDDDGGDLSDAISQGLISDSSSSSFPTVTFPTVTLPPLPTDQIGAALAAGNVDAAGNLYNSSGQIISYGSGTGGMTGQQYGAYLAAGGGNPATNPATAGTSAASSTLNVPPSAANLTSLLAGIVNTAGAVAKVATAPAGSIIGANGQVITPGAIAASSISSALPLLLGGGLLLLVVFSRGKK